jgi:hypothetical protein
MIDRRIFILCLIMISGCASTASGPLFSQAPIAPTSMGTLYCLSAAAPFMSPMIKVTINGKDFVTLKGKGYSYIYLPQGIYRLGLVMATTRMMMTEIDVEPGRDLFELFDPFNYTISEIPAAQALEMFKDFRYVAPLNIKLP